MQNFRNFILQKFILNFDTEQVYLKPQVTNFTNKKVIATLNPKPLKTIGFSKTLNPKPYTLYPY